MFNMFKVIFSEDQVKSKITMLPAKVVSRQKGQTCVKLLKHQMYKMYKMPMLHFRLLKQHVDSALFITFQTKCQLHVK